MAKAKKAEIMKTPAEISKWIGTLKRAELIRGRADETFGYSRAHLEFQGDYVSAMPSFMQGVDLVPINEVYAYAKTFIPTVYTRDPYITCNPQNAKSAPGAKINELFINAKWRELNLKRAIKRCILDAIFSEGWVKTGYTSVFGKIEPKEGEPALEPSEFIQDEEVFCERVSWRNMLRDTDAIDGIHDARWVAQEIIRPLEAVKASSIYENTAKLQPSFIVRPDSDDRMLRQARDTGYDTAEEVAYARLWEIWDRDSNRVFTISEGCEGFLKNEKWPYKIQGFPFALLRFNENPDECYAPNLIAAWEPQLWEKIKIRAMQLDHIKRFNRQLSVEKGAMTPAEMDMFKKGITGSVIERAKGTEPPKPIEYAQIQPDIYAVENKIDLDKDNISGQPNAVRSAPQKTQSRTLGEIDRLISAFSSRQGEPQDIVEDFCEEIAYKLLGISEQYMTGEQYVRATGKDIEAIGKAILDPVTGESRFDGTGFRFTKEDIKGIEYELDVKSGSTLPLDKQNRTDALVQILKLGPTIGINPGSKVSRMLGKALISEFDMKEVEAAYDEEQKAIEKQAKMGDAIARQGIEQGELKLANLKKMRDAQAGVGAPGQ